MIEYAYFRGPLVAVEYLYTFMTSTVLNLIQSKSIWLNKLQKLRINYCMPSIQEHVISNSSSRNCDVFVRQVLHISSVEVWQKLGKGEWISIFLIYKSPVQKGMPVKAENHKNRSNLRAFIFFSFLLPLSLSYCLGQDPRQKSQPQITLYPRRNIT